MPNLLDLSNEILLDVFTSLPKQALSNIGTTCRRVRQLAYPVVWSQFSTSLDHRNPAAQEIERVKQVAGLSDSKELAYVREVRICIKRIKVKPPRRRRDWESDEEESWDDEEDGGYRGYGYGPNRPGVRGHKHEKPFREYFQAVARILAKASSVERVDLDIDAEMLEKAANLTRPIGLIWEPLFALPKLHSLRLCGAFPQDGRPYTPSETVIKSIRTSSLRHLTIAFRTDANNVLSILGNLPKLSALVFDMSTLDDHSLGQFECDQWVSKSFQDFWRPIRTLAFVGGWMPRYWHCLVEELQLPRRERLDTISLDTLRFDRNFFTVRHKLLHQRFSTTAEVFASDRVKELAIPRAHEDPWADVLGIARLHFPNLTRLELCDEVDDIGDIGTIVKALPSFNALQVITLPSITGTKDKKELTRFRRQRSTLCRSPKRSAIWAAEVGFHDAVAKCPGLVRIWVLYPGRKEEWFVRRNRKLDKMRDGAERPVVEFGCVIYVTEG